MHKCYLCGKKNKDDIEYTYIYSPDIHDEPRTVVVKLCKECAEWASVVPEAMDAIIYSRECIK